MIEIEKNGEKITYHDEFYSVARDGEHWIRLTDGCFRQCWKLDIVEEEYKSVCSAMAKYLIRNVWINWLSYL